MMKRNRRRSNRKRRIMNTEQFMLTAFIHINIIIQTD